jgi:hypothetical protein
MYFLNLRKYLFLILILNLSISVLTESSTSTPSQLSVDSGRIIEDTADFESLKRAAKSEIYTDKNLSDLNRSNFDKNIKIKEDAQKWLAEVDKRKLKLQTLGGLNSNEQVQKYQKTSAKLAQYADFFYNKAKNARSRIFKFELDKTIKALIKSGNIDNASDLEELKLIQSCLIGPQNPLDRIKKSFSDVFEKIFTKFWNKNSLNNEDCEVLEKTFSVWSSFYDDENGLKKNEAEPYDQTAIPVYNVNNHNASFYAWATEQRKGRIPPEGATLVHVDSHTDMGHIHSHLSSKHWIKSVSVKEIQSALNKSNSDTEFILKLQAAVKSEFEKKHITQEIANDIATRISYSDPSQLRRELEKTIELNVYHIAQPVTAAASSNVMNNRMFQVTPYFTNEFPRESHELCLIRNKDIEEFFLSNKSALLRNNKYEFKKGRLYDKAKNQYYNISSGDCSNKAKVTKDVQMSVYNTYVEDNDFIGNDSKGNPLFENSSVDLPEKSYYEGFSNNDRGYILDLDLDSFATNGLDHTNVKSEEPSVMPISPFRSNPEQVQDKHEVEYGKHGVHPNPASEVLSDEFSVVKKRMDLFFRQVQDAKDKGYVPSVITICDSTGIERAALARDRAEAIATDGVYTPKCLAFLFNYYAKKKLKGIFGNQLKL